MLLGLLRAGQLKVFLCSTASQDLEAEEVLAKLHSWGVQAEVQGFQIEDIPLCEPRFSAAQPQGAGGQGGLESLLSTTREGLSLLQVQQEVAQAVNIKRLKHIHSHPHFAALHAGVCGAV